jgi:hypothetical protein
MTNEFITEGRYLKAVSPKTEAWYRDSFRAFEGALDSRSSIINMRRAMVSRSRR